MRVRWSLWSVLVCLLFAGGAQAQSAAPTVIPLWPDAMLADSPIRGPEQVGRDGTAAGAVSNIGQPRMEIYRAAKPNGTAVLIAGGGGYFRIQIGRGSQPVAKWLAATGVTAAVLYYRLPGDGWPAVAPFQDGQRALRMLRARADEFGIDPEKIGVLGMSAGGNLAAVLGSRYDTAFYTPTEALDQLSARPAFMALIYPVISLKAPLDATRSKRELSTQKDAVAAYSAEQHVARGVTAPAFIAHAADDPIVDVGHSLAMFDALRAQSVPAELHVFETGGHSWGLGQTGSPVAAWPRLFASWARQRGFMGGSRVTPQPPAANPSEN